MGDQDQIQVTQEPIIIGLPDDIALSCVARVPRKYHRTLRCVSRRWRDLVCSEDWYSFRKKQKLEETWIYALCRDGWNTPRCYVLDPDAPIRCWAPIKQVPSHFKSRIGTCIEVLGKKIYLMGGETLDGVSDKVYSYDASADTWSQAPSLAAPRAFFACHALDKKIYVFGGLDRDISVNFSWETYDPLTSKTTSHSECNVVHTIEDSLVMDGKIRARCRWWAAGGKAHWHTLVGDKWQSPDADLPSEWRGPVVLVDRRLYMLEMDKDYWVKKRLCVLLMWKEETREWVPVWKHLAEKMSRPCQLVAVGNTIFIVGECMSTIAVDVGNGTSSNVKGVVLCSWLPGLPRESDIISCRCLAI